MYDICSAVKTKINEEKVGIFVWLQCLFSGATAVRTEDLFPGSDWTLPADGK